MTDYEKLAHALEVFAYRLAQQGVIDVKDADEVALLLAADTDETTP